MLEKKFITNQPEWDQTLLTLPHAHILQSWEWGQFKSRWGWSAQRLLWLNAGHPVAAAQILKRSVPRTPWRFLYVSKGPAFDYTNIKLAQKIVTDLEATARQNRALFIKIDPDVVRRYGEPQPDTVDVAEGRLMQELLTSRGWHFSPEQIQFRNTVVVDLTPATADLLAALKSKWRYNIRLAERKGVVIRRGNKADIPLFYHMYAQTAARDGFLIRPQAYYADVWHSFLKTGQAEMLLAEVENEVVAGLILFICGPTAWYMYGASTGRHRQFMPNHLLQWHAIRRAKEKGCAAYDMWGAPDVFDETDRLIGVYRFKQGFGGQVVQGLGAYDYPANRPLYWAFTTALPRLRSLMRQFKK